MNHGVPKNLAAARVADYAVRWPRISIGRITARTVTHWRDEFLQAPYNDADRRHFEGLSRIFSQGSRSKSYLDDAIRRGPVLTGGVRKKINSET
jgi:hypothetical protein